MLLLSLFLAAVLAAMVIHEAGHFVMARVLGIRVREVGLGLPPVIWRRRLGADFTVALGWLPIGAYVSLDGDDCASGALWRELLAIAAGSLFNFVGAYVALVVLLLTPLPTDLWGGEFPVVEKVYAGSAAAESGMRSGDVILEVNGEPVMARNLPGRIVATRDYGGVYRVKRGEVVVELVILPHAERPLGISFLVRGPQKRARAPAEAVWDAGRFFVHMVGMLGMMAWHWLEGDWGDGFRLERLSLGFSPSAGQITLALMVLVSLIMGLSNWLPWPMLDGGQMVLAVGRHYGMVSPELLESLNYAGLCMLVSIAGYYIFRWAMQGML